MTLQEDLLAEIMRALPGMRIAETTFGRLAVNDGKLVRRLRAGDNVTVSTIERVRAFLEAQEYRAAASPRPPEASSEIAPSEAA